MNDITNKRLDEEIRDSLPRSSSKYDPTRHPAILSAIMQHPKLRNAAKANFYKIAEISAPTLRKWERDFKEIKDIFANQEKYPFRSQEKEDDFNRRVEYLRIGEFEAGYNREFHLELLIDLMRKDKHITDVMVKFCSIAKIAESKFKKWVTAVEEFGDLVRKPPTKLNPVKYNPEIHLDFFISGFKTGETVKDLCSEAGINSVTFYKWKNQYSEFGNMIKKYYVHNPTLKYDPEIHIPMLMDVLKVGESISDFCAKATITLATFNNWMDQYSQFSYTYDVYINHSKAIWEKRGMDKNVNSKNWLFIFNGRFRNKWKIKPHDTSDDILRKAQEMLENRHNIEYSPTIDEVLKFVTMALNKKQVEEIDDAEPEPTLGREALADMAKVMAQAVEIEKVKRGSKNDEKS